MNQEHEQSPLLVSPPPIDTAAVDVVVIIPRMVKDNNKRRHSEITAVVVTDDDRSCCCSLRGSKSSCSSIDGTSMRSTGVSSTTSSSSTITTPPMCMDDTGSREKLTKKKKIKKVRRNISWDVRPIRICNSNDPHPVLSQQQYEEDFNDDNNTSINDRWYSKEDYQRMCIEQRVTIDIMRSLRIILARSVEAKKSAAIVSAIDTNENSSIISNTSSSNSSNDSYNIDINKNSSGYELIQKAYSMIDTENYCERGLESYSSEEKRNTISLNRKLHVSTVIVEQTRQWINGRRDPERIRMTSMVRSKQSSLKAQLLAAIDHQQMNHHHHQAKNQDISEQPRPVIQLLTEHCTTTDSDMATKVTPPLFAPAG